MLALTQKRLVSNVEYKYVHLSVPELARTGFKPTDYFSS